MTTQDYAQLKTLLATPKKLVIVPHVNPDGDAMGSCLALYLYLKRKKHNVTVVAPNDYPDFLKWLPEESSVVKYEYEKDKGDKLLKNAEVVFTLDFNALNRTGLMQETLEQLNTTFVLIDHHQQPDNYAKFIYSDVSMSSTCEMVYHFINNLDDGASLNAEMATCLYTGIMTDTGSFRFPSTTSKTHEVIAHLIDCGAENATIHNNIYDTNSYSRLQLLGRALQNLKVLPEYRTAYITLSQEELDTFNFKKGDTEGFVNYGLSLENIVMAVIFIENKQDSVVKISLRSKGDFSVNELSRAHFNGGGHINAAGGKSDLSLTDTIDKFISILPHYKNALNHV